MGDMGTAASAEMGIPTNEEIDAVLQRKEMRAMVKGVEMSPSEKLFDFAYYGNHNAISELLRKSRREVDLDFTHEIFLGRTPLMAAAFAGHRNVVDQLISAGASVHLRDNDGKTAADWARAAGENGIAVALDKFQQEMPATRGGSGEVDGDRFSRNQREVKQMRLTGRQTVAPPSRLFATKLAI